MNDTTSNAMSTQQRISSLSGFNLIQLLMAPNRQDKYLQIDEFTHSDSLEFPGCMKSMEFFMADICTNLQEWSIFDLDSVVYRTIRYWYIFQLRNDDGIIWMTRYCARSYRRWDDWMNIHSGHAVGKSWLLQEPQRSKFRSLCTQGDR